ncbi:MAG: hypothetical protein M0R33_18010 [Methylomonas sp.]|uniref:hypothetical protein n=1 Tax=Methylomonas sp. TaxID=418 RepID=UPI0025DF07A6|nr:hypothetical protein [Methylomonas sp.]MCK9608344.1 hypothetical protein [Methylomonas sp.]
MNPSTLSRTQCAVVLFILRKISIDPIPITSSICLYMAIFRPVWFKRLVETIYADINGKD